MKNFNRIKSMNEQEFAEYIESVFLAGRMYEKKLHTFENLKLEDMYDLKMYNYNNWLNTESIIE